MEKRITDRAFFTQPAEELAKALIGKIICHEVGNENEKFVIKARIKTTEAYRHTDDVTDANRENENNAQLLEGGHIHLYTKKGEGRKRLDIVAGTAGTAESVLIRGLDAYVEGPQIAVWAMDIDDSADGMDLLAENATIWLVDDGTLVELQEAKPRKGLSETSNTKDELLYFTAKNFKF